LTQWKTYKYQTETNYVAQFKIKKKLKGKIVKKKLARKINQDLVLKNKIKKKVRFIGVVGLSCLDL